MRWQDDKAFVQWLYQMEYAEKTPKGPSPRMSGGVVLYMYEAWRGALNEPVPVSDLPLMAYLGAQDGSKGPSSQGKGGV